ncbi:MAG: chromosomal replication initiator DnaA [Rhodobiaceae bacterium]|nr:chromosomal replication initiator DnaA [Rhodobiaceae bacterium]MCC0053006.1 chromosomal replication initiator DnaA [Rhodobiaceae bacterium]
MTAAGGEQLAFDLAFRPAMGREDFMVGASNQAAVALLDAYPAWSPQVAVIVGPHGSGKTHLGEVWRARSDAVRVEAATLGEAGVAAIIQARNGLIEDIPAHGRVPDETSLFHVLNAALQGRVFLLLTSRVPPASWPVATPDIVTRLRLVPVCRIEPPDDGLFAAVILKLLADRQLTIAANAVRYAVPRIERSFAAAARFVDMVERIALERRRPATLGVVREVVKALGDSDLT